MSITALGEATGRGPLLRNGARPGDEIVVTGEFGGSILAKHLDFEPRVNEATLLHERFDLTAGIDVSDGLGIDLMRICQASDVGVEVEIEDLEGRSELQRWQAGGLGSVREWGLGGGDDHIVVYVGSVKRGNKIFT